jgi:RNA polymerase sigma-70 factor (ECF subfamily)
MDADLPVAGRRRSPPAPPRPAVDASSLSDDPQILSMPPLGREDEQRFRRMLASHVDFVWRCLRRMGVPPGDCDDAAQQVFLVAAAKLSAIAVGCERAFLFGTATRIAANARRSLHRRDEAQLLLLQHEAHQHESQEDLSDQLRARAMMDGILREMPDELREVFVLFELEELAVGEVAEILSIPIGTVGSRLRRARDDFQQRVHRHQASGPRARGTR